MATIVRKANKEEIGELKQYLIQEVHNGDEETVNSWVSTALIAVFPKFESGSPGYDGRVMIVLYDGGPEHLEIYIWIKGQIEQVIPETPNTVY